ncbi:hypothetical protein B0H14DRAFT_2567486 [Mycena olivaceomarginata]|nr:hypothetical protein B0H14DRAFT_2567486 [Mycena olivaceomarginata]
MAWTPPALCNADRYIIFYFPVPPEKISYSFKHFGGGKQSCWSVADIMPYHLGDPPKDIVEQTKNRAGKEGLLLGGGTQIKKFEDHSCNLWAQRIEHTFHCIRAKQHVIVRLYLHTFPFCKEYPISRNTIFNVSTAQSDDVNSTAEPTATWTTQADKSAMLKVYFDFCPLVVRMLKLVPESKVCKWKLCMHHPLRMWVEGNVALLCDACHPTLPVSSFGDRYFDQSNVLWGGAGSP